MRCAGRPARNHLRREEAVQIRTADYWQSQKLKMILSCAIPISIPSDYRASCDMVFAVLLVLHRIMPSLGMAWHAPKILSRPGITAWNSLVPYFAFIRAYVFKYYSSPIREPDMGMLLHGNSPTPWGLHCIGREGNLY